MRQQVAAPLAPSVGGGDVTTLTICREQRMLFQQLLAQQLLQEIQLDFTGARSAARIGHAGAGMERGSALEMHGRGGEELTGVQRQSPGIPAP